MAVARSSLSKLAFPLCFVLGVGCSGVDAKHLTGDDQDSGQTDVTDQDETSSDPGGDYGDVGSDGGDDVDPGDTDPEPTPIYGLDARPPQTTCQAFTAPPVTANVSFVNRFPNVEFKQPSDANDQITGLAQRPGDNSRWYVLTRQGRLKYLPNEPTATTADVKMALDLSAVSYAGWDCSLASVNFPADFEHSHVAYIGYCYAYPSDSSVPHVQIRLSRFRTDDGGATFDPASEQIVLAIDYMEDSSHSQSQDGLHAGDAAHFGTDGYLYMSVGDGGPQGKTGGKQAQDLKQLRGKLLRFDVSDLTKDPLPDDGFLQGRQRLAADIPPDNPFFGYDEDVAQPAIWAYGFRNPWQWSFDSLTGKIWLGDVGNNTYEEIDRDVKKGGNYGWGYYEGFHCANGWSSDAAHPCDDPSFGFHAPFLEYTHGDGADQGKAVSGGIVYRGSAVPSHVGAYFFADSQNAHIWAVMATDTLPETGANCSTVPCADGLVCMTSGTLFVTDPDGTVDPEGKQPRCQAPKITIQNGVPIAAFHEDQDGELYAASLAGQVLILQATPADPEDTPGGPPSLLSQTGCFGSDDIAQPVADLVPFAPSAELWSDGAEKRRWMVVPDDKTVTVEADGDFVFPAGSMLVKEFSIAGKKIETRFLVRQAADGRWAGYSYAWNDEETDATLVADIGEQRSLEVQTWSYPGRQQCFRCHNTVAGVALGPEVAQVNHEIVYPATGKTANQMDTLTHIGLVDASAYAPPYPSLAPIADETRSVEERARAYLHANCSICHRPNGPTFTPPDFRYETAFTDTNVCDALPTISDLEELIPDNPRLLSPGDPTRSQIYVRLDTIDTRFMMPPLAKSIAHAAAVEVIGQWITGITSCEP